MTFMPKRVQPQQAKPRSGVEHNGVMSQKVCEFQLPSGKDCGKPATDQLFAMPSRDMRRAAGLRGKGKPRPFYACPAHGVGLVDHPSQAGFCHQPSA